MMRFVSFVLAAALSLAARDTALTQVTPAPSPEVPVPEQTLPPDLQTTWDWLANALPTSAADASGQRQLDERDAEYRLSGCDLTVSVGTWSQSTYSNVSMWPDAWAWVYLVRFEPRAGYYFYDRPMSGNEARAFQQRHFRGSGEFKYGIVNVIDMSEASLSSFTVIGEEKVSYLPFAGLQERGKYAYFRIDDESHAYAVRNALLNAARLCGAKEEANGKFGSPPQ